MQSIHSANDGSPGHAPKPNRAGAAARLACAALLVTAGTAGCSATGIRAASAVPAAVTSRSAPTVPPHQANPTPLPLGPCTTSDLSVSATGEHPDDGLRVARFVLADIGPGACTLTGSPGISPEGVVSAGDPDPEVNLAVSQLPVPDELGAIAQPGGTYTLQHGGTAVFFIAWFDASPVVCEDGEGFAFNAPGDTNMDDSSPVDYPFGPMCDGLFYASQVLSPSAQG